ncbi:MAG: CsgG/HfaB family protein [Treponema sp.]|nr:CsgG/HfaB family protein [Treponema sp.]
MYHKWVFFTVVLVWVSGAAYGQSSVSDQVSAAFKGAQTDITIAVLDFKNISGEQSLLGRYLSEQAINHLATKTKLKVVERGQLDQVMRELDFYAEGYVSDESMIELGGMLGVDAVVLGTLAKVGRKISVSMRVVDARTAAILTIGSSELKGAEYLKMYSEIMK